MAKSTNTFKRRLAIYIYWQDQETIYDFRAQLQRLEVVETYLDMTK